MSLHTHGSDFTTHQHHHCAQHTHTVQRHHTSAGHMSWGTPADHFTSFTTAAIVSTATSLLHESCSSTLCTTHLFVSNTTHTDSHDNTHKPHINTHEDLCFNSKFCNSTVQFVTFEVRFGQHTDFYLLSQLHSCSSTSDTWTSVTRGHTPC